MPQRSWASGTGPGPIAPDGSAVELYAALGPGPDADIVDAAVPAGAAILELGAGAGRTAHELHARGHHVVAVDESPEMLARVRDVVTVCETIEDLSLGRAFDAVLMASHLVNVPDDGLCDRMLRTCRRHVRPGGTVILQRHAPGWFDDPPRSLEGGGPADAATALREVTRPGPGLLSATAEYRLDGRVWTHSFTVRRLDDARLDRVLADAGLALDAYLTADRTWVRAVPAAA
ncbi:class I SAM-dependent methyltransferase [Actinomadura viridis]|uniref:SAM-dependent methyltransferase n=1 Tax=Actinomadura viridis TaxID=58110 RepID=A0A931DJ86_9ACTN|nr:class I SAM-dependent methyltransferase [Actinomadura viridis]MBG6088576.1 SAM-dependent methyltransferase [Actinomadura viridis]